MSTAVTDRVLECFAHKKVVVPDGLILPADNWNIQPGQSVFRVITPTDGDKRVVWNRGSIPDINAARKMFTDLVTAGMVPYRVGAGGQASSTVMDKFDPAAEEVIFMPMKAIAGG